MARFQMNQKGSTYLAGIRALDDAAGDTQMRAVWDMRTTAGRTEATTNTYVRDTTRPAGWSEDTGTGRLYSPTTDSWSLSNWDLKTGSGQILGRGGATMATVSQCEFGHTSSSQIFAIAENGLSVASNWTIDRCTFDGTEMNYAQAGSGQRAAIVQGYANATNLTITNCRWVKTPLCGFKTIGQNLTMDSCFIGSFAHDPTSDAHIEGMFIDRAGSGSKISKTCFDPSGFVPTLGGLTGTIYCEAQSQDIILEFEQCIITKGHWAAAYTIQAAARGAGRVCTLHFDRCAIEAGSIPGARYIGPTETEGGVLTVTSSGSVDLRTGANIDSILNAI